MFNKIFKASISLAICVSIIAVNSLTAFAAEEIDKPSPLPNYGTSTEKQTDTLTVKPSATNTKFQNSDYYRFFGSQLTKDYEIKLYESLENQLLRFRDKTASDRIYFTSPIQVPSSYTGSEDTIRYFATLTFQKAIDAFRFDHPEYYWTTGNNAITNITLKYYNDGSVYISDIIVYFQPSTMKSGDSAKIDAMINNIVAEAQKKNSDYEKIKTVHDMLAKQIKYVNSGHNYRDFQITGAFADGRGVCEAYAKAFKIITGRLGYRSILVAGTGENKGSQLPHMWNYIRLGDKWYAVDITWDDQPILLHDYFLVGSSTNAPNIDNKTFGATHIKESVFSNIEYNGFSYPALSETKYAK